MTASAFRQGNEAENWQSEPWKHMFSPVNRRFIRALVYVLVAGQLLLSAPIASAFSSNTATAASEMPCADSMPQPDDSKPCPCCPEGTVGVAACLSACTGSIASIPSLEIRVSRAPLVEASPLATVPIAEFADPPLKPPPIV